MSRKSKLAKQPTSQPATQPIRNLSCPAKLSQPAQLPSQAGQSASWLSSESLAEKLKQQSLTKIGFNFGLSVFKKTLKTFFILLILFIMIQTKPY